MKDHIILAIVQTTCSMTVPDVKTGPVSTCELIENLEICLMLRFDSFSHEILMSGMLYLKTYTPNISFFITRSASQEIKLFHSGTILNNLGQGESPDNLISNMISDQDLENSMVKFFKLFIPIF